MKASYNSHERPGATGDSVVTSVSSRLLLSVLRNSINSLGIEILNSELFTLLNLGDLHYYFG